MKTGEDKLKNLKLGVSPLTDTVLVGELLKGKNEWRIKRSFQREFMNCLMEWCPPGYMREINCPAENKKYQVKVTEVKEPPLVVNKTAAQVRAEKLPTYIPQH